MPLQRIEGEITRESRTFSFTMRIVGSAQILRVVVADDALAGGDGAAGDEELQAQLEADRACFESLAEEKYDHGRVTAEGIVWISAADVLDFLG